MNTLLLAIVGHLVGDYLLQNDWMALNKKKQALPCLVHCILWTIAVCAFSGCFNPLVVSLLLVTHFIQDRTNIVFWWMTKVNKQQSFATGPCAPWSIIVVDNVWHIVTITAIWRFLI